MFIKVKITIYIIFLNELPTNALTTFIGPNR